MRNPRRTLWDVGLLFIFLSASLMSPNHILGWRLASSSVAKVPVGWLG